MSDPGSDRVVICGAGVTGAATAYYLAQQGIAATVVERGDVACAASGKAGGFLAADWLDGGPTGPLTRRSFQLHVQLAEELGAASIGFRPVETLSLELADPGGVGAPLLKGWCVCEGRQRQQGKGLLPGWMDGSISHPRAMGTTSTTAQVHPAKLTHAFLDAAAERVGTRVRRGVVEGLEQGADGAVTGVRVDGEVLPADRVVLALGPWTGLARGWVKSAPPIFGSLGHSIVIQASQPLSAHCLFVNHRSKSGVPSSPEVFCRPDGTAYIVEGSEFEPLPSDPLQVQPEEEKCDRLQEVAAALSTSLASGTVERRQACFRPYAPDGQPVIGPLPGAPGVFVASGGGCWGILWSCATGEAIAELVRGAEPTLNLRAFSPGRFSKSPGF